MNKLYTLVSPGSFRCWLCCLLFFVTTAALAQPKVGYSYVNITKKTVGGTVEPGDVLEVRYSVMFPWGFNAANNRRVYRVRYYDNVPSNTTMLTGGTDRLRIITNEGTTFYQYTLATGDDAGNYKATAVAPEYKIRINIGGPLGLAPTAPANNLTTDLTGGGTINLTASGTGDQPKWWTGHLFSTSFRVQVSGTYGQTITMGGGRLYYSLLSNGSGATFLPVPTYTIMIAKDDALCDNKVGSNFAAESGGTFGNAAGLNRAAGPAFPVPSYSYVNNVSASVAVNDGSYAIVNNTSPRSSTNTNARHIPNCGTGATAADDCNNRMFGGHWDIIGDHTGQTTGASNNPPASTTSSGYMLMVNSDMVTSEAYKQTINSLCPNTTYEFSAWVKNICSTCGSNANLVATNLPGVLPNLTFVLDGVDRYSTGEIAYGSSWVKKGFTFTTGPTQSSVTFSIRNNAQGGGGNDWVMDDISIASCTPNLIMKPYGNATVCYGNPVDFAADIESISSNYTHWRWEKSNDGGTNWINETSGTGTPVLASGKYTYTVDHPSFTGDSSAHGDIIRLRVATTAGNLDDNSCSFLASTQVVILVNNCQNVLSSDITQFKAQQINAGVSLRWAAVNEMAGLKYQIEKSTDQRNWKKLPVVSAKVTAGQNNYTELDPGTLSQTTHYRISMVLNDKIKYTHQVTVQPNSSVPSGLTIKTIQNPFSNSLPFELVVPENGEVNIMLFDLYGKPQKQLNWKVSRGSNRLNLSETSTLSAGNYILMVRFNDQVAQKKVLKMN
ncbi:T9SS type A sorting domain-containing protein [Flavihumibacter fluvii]|uniref:T9SS type A sorting domain-containing protein n=1 Tax=Flavihumibacter fluvii TaxID=2838157 RepID=UPI001BDF322E|nr:T9SS type A sorting domain-containing protein [Flavihumibacter fluvii]ULQ51083.1 T9SS type A sorting domain-containing protein [Flavihumibacter fluvii]